MFKCPKCPAICLDQERVRYHIKRYHRGLRVCPACGLPVAGTKQFYLHMNKKHDVQTSTLCVYCGGFFISNAEGNDHIEKVHSSESGCAKCGSKLICYCADELTNSQEPVEPETLSAAREMNPELSPLPSTSRELPLRQKLADLSHNTKCAIVTKMRLGKTARDISKLYDITPGVAYKIWLQRGNFVLETDMKSNIRMNKMVEQKLLEWFRKQRTDNVKVTANQFSDQAEKYAVKIGFAAFIADRKWLAGFRSKHNITLRPHTRIRPSMRGSLSRVPFGSKAKTLFMSEVWPEVSRGYNFNQIYTADEVGIFYNASEGRILKHTGRKYIHGHDKDRFSIFMCTNITGNDRDRIMVCGTEDPLSNDQENMQTLPVQYVKQSDCQFTTEIFEEYVIAWNEELKKKNGKALLILDRNSIHSKLKLSNLRLVFLPSNASAGLMPIKQGIFANFFEQFRKLRLKQNALIVHGVDKEMTSLEGLDMLREAWNKVPRKAIIEAFKVIGYKVPKIRNVSSESDESVEVERICELLRRYEVPVCYQNTKAFDMFFKVDEALLTAQGTNRSKFGGCSAHQSAQEGDGSGRPSGG